MRLDIEKLEAFVTVAQVRSFTKAAEKLHRTQPSVSMQIRRLEDNIGHVLLDRTSQTVSLTPAGMRLLPGAQRLLEIHDRTRTVFQLSLLKGKVRAGIPEWYATEQLPTMLVDFAKTHPGIKIEMTVGDSAMLRRRISEGSIDIALAIRDPDGPPTPRIWQEALYWVSSLGHVRTDPVPLILFDEPCPYRHIADTYLTACGRRWTEVMTSNSVAAVRVAVQSGLGVSILPAGAVNQHLRILGEEDGFPDIPPTDLAIYLGENTESDASGAVEVLRQFLSDHVAQRLMMLQRKTAI